jgi:hypothetical protein
MSNEDRSTTKLAHTLGYYYYPILLLHLSMGVIETIEKHKEILVIILHSSNCFNTAELENF